MTSAEFSLWLDYYQDDLWGEMRAYERAGVIAATVANYAGMMRGKGSEPATPQDFMPHMHAEEPERVEPDPVAYFTDVAKRVANG